MAVNLRDQPRHYYTMEEYLALEQAGEARYEYWDGEIVCMSGGSRQHARISSNVHLAIGQQLKGKSCTVYTGDLPIKTPSLPPYRYPDISAGCGRLVFENISGIDVLTNPILIVEVLSPATENLDRGEKRSAYQMIPSMMEQVLIAQDAPHVTLFLRRPPGSEWVRHDMADLAASITLQSLHCELSLADIYEGVDFNQVERRRR